MLDDDDFDSELLGGLQRHQNLKQNEATRQEIAALRADFNRKEAAEKAAPKCPYCAGAITGGAVKCRHCASDIKWCGVYGISYPIKADANAEQFAAQKRQELEPRRRAEEEQNKRLQAAALKPESLMADKIAGILMLLAALGCLWPLMFFSPNGWGSDIYDAAFGKILMIVGLLAFGGSALFYFKRAGDTHNENKRKAKEARHKARVKARDKAMAAKITVNCPVCGQEMHVTRFPNEQVIQCEHCLESFVVPAVK